jgi:hypothetical protein
MRPLLAALFLAALSTAAPAATITNGSLEGEVRNGVVNPPAVPFGWSVRRQTPDTSDTTGNAGGLASFAVAPSGPSPDGGTWVSIGADAGLTVGGQTFNESIQTQISGLTIGETYRIGWLVGNFGVIFGPGDVVQNAPGAIRALVNGVEIGTGALRQVGSGWYAEFAEFSATSATSFLAFETALSGTAGASYLALDGVTIARATDPIGAVPLPASLPLLLAALGLAPVAMAGRRRRTGRA